MKLLTELRKTNSRIDKERLLRDISLDDWKVFVTAYHPDSIFHMTCILTGGVYIGKPTEAMFDLLDSILSKELFGARAKDAVEDFALEHGDLIKLIVNKDMRCGVTATIFNKVYPGSIPQFKVQLAKEVDIQTIEYPVLAQLKYDGVRLIAMIDDNVCTFKTRNGKVVHLPELAKTIEALPFTSYILDGEIVLETGKQEDRTRVSGMINSAMHGGSVIETAMVFHVFDTMPLSEFNDCRCDTVYEDRFLVLKLILASKPVDSIQLAITNEVHSAKAATDLYEDSLAMGYEGLVLKYPDHTYTFKRSKDWIKVKEIKSADLTVVDIQDGTGKYEGMIGALVCKGVVDGKDITVSVGSGLSDLQRGLPFSEFYGKTVEVLYNTAIQDSVTSAWSLFLPRFVQVRHDL